MSIRGIRSNIPPHHLANIHIHTSLSGPIVVDSGFQSSLRLSFIPTMASNRVRRVQKELADMQSDQQAQVMATPAGAGNDLMHLKGSFKGPEGTPYEGGEYIIDIQIPSEYPFKPPKMRFETKVWHPNVSSQTVTLSPLPKQRI